MTYITGSGVDRVDGGDGIDTIVLGSEVGDVTTVNLGREWQYSDGGWNLIRNVENVTMGSGNDIIQGNDVSNVITAGAGDDWLYGGAGDDVLIGGEGATGCLVVRVMTWCCGTPMRTRALA